MSRSSQIIRQEIESGYHDARLARARHAGFLDQINRWAASLTMTLTTHQGSGDRPENAGTAGLEQNPFALNLAGARECVRLIEDSPAWAVATGPLAALHAELDAALAREAEADAEESAARIALEAAEAAARVKFEAKVGTDPAVVKARAALAGIKRLGEPLDLAPA